MKKPAVAALALCVLSLSASCTRNGAADINQGVGLQTTPRSQDQQQVTLPLFFEERSAGASTSFLAHGAGQPVWLTPRGMNMQLPGDSKDRAALRMRFLGANPSPRMTGAGQLAGRINRLVGPRDQWQRNLPTHSEVRYESVYPGIDVDFYGNGVGLEYDFRIGAHRDPGVIALSFQRARSLRVDPSGDLLVTKAGGTVRHHAPVAYQNIAGTRREVPARYAIESPTRVGFEVGAFDRSHPLTIDPVLSFSTYLGGFDFEYGKAIAVDPAGGVYVAGYTQSRTLATPGSFDPTFNGGYTDPFVAKLSPGGDRLIYLTYLGGQPDGSKSEGALALAVDGNGAAYITGRTSSYSFPTTPGALDRSFNSGYDAFVTKLDPSGGKLAYSTYLGGPYDDEGYGIAIDAGGSAYVTGRAAGRFPTTTGAFDTDATNYDVFVSKLSPGGERLSYSTFLGGLRNEQGNAIAIAPGGAVIVTGKTDSENYAYDPSYRFPTTQGAFDRVGKIHGDAFVAKVNATGSNLDYSTYLAGAESDQGAGVAVDAAGYAYVTGNTGSSDFPTTAGALDRSPAGDVFITKVNPNGSGLAYSTGLGGSAGDAAKAGAVDSSGRFFVTGLTQSPDFPTTKGAVRSSYVQNSDPLGNTDAFVTVLNSLGSGVTYSTYLGGSKTGNTDGFAPDVGHALALRGGSVYVTGQSESRDFPVTAGSLDSSFNGAIDLFVTKIDVWSP